MISKDALLAACMMHVEGYYSTKSLAFRNCNPGNLEKDGTLRKFSTPIYGFMALLEDIAANRGKSLKDFLFKYAPPKENNTNLYLQIVSELSGVKPEDLI